MTEVVTDDVGLPAQHTAHSTQHTASEGSGSMAERAGQSHPTHTAHSTQYTAKLLCCEIKK
jgi:hypothetical protein